MGHKVKRFGFQALVWASLSVAISSAWACKYNVRDVGFVDWDPAPYQLLAFVEEESAVARAIRYTGAASFLDANVELVVRENPTPSDLDPYQVEELPALVLTGADERWLDVPLPPQSTADAVQEALESVVVSPIREKLLSRLVEAYGVVLVVESEDPTANVRVRQAVTSAVQRVNALLDRLPKAVDGPPEVLFLDPTVAREERVLLWSLGLDAEQAPGVAVVYGRARRMGPVLQGGLITETAVYRALAVMGQDCECDLDRSWMTGPLLPVRWSRSQQEAVQRWAGFDAESPMIKAEISRIVARGPSPNAQRVGLPRADAGLDFDLLGYSEVSVEELASPEEVGSPEGEEEVKQTAVALEENINGGTQGMATPTASPSWKWLTIVVLAGIVVIGLGGGAALLWRGRQGE